MSIKHAGKNFRDHLRLPDDPRIAGITSEDAYSWAKRVLNNPRAGGLFAGWRKRYQESDFFGVTSDGHRMDGLFTLAPEGAPVTAMIAATQLVLSLASESQRQVLCHSIDAREWRGWMNPEVYMNQFGLRLEELDNNLREAILGVLESSMSASGYSKVRNLMRINHFLGELVNGNGVLNEFSYNFNLFGTPGLDEPWGWSFYGHHVCLSCLVLGEQMVVTPVFLGAEPEHVDQGPWAGLRVFEAEERLGLQLMRSLDPVTQARVWLYRQKRDPSMPPGRVAMADELHLCGAFQDNRVVPYEGGQVRLFSVAAKEQLRGLVKAYLDYLPDGPLQARLRDYDGHLDNTWFCWIGGIDDDSPFYYRIQSPVLIIEFDHHAGVFLGNSEPEKFHIHTLIRTPNGNDYGRALVCQHCERTVSRT